MYPWQGIYDAAVLETDQLQMMSRIEAAYRAIEERLEEFMKGDGETVGERAALESALGGLAMLRKERVKVNWVDTAV
jgi:hypothetical protein